MEECVRIMAGGSMADVIAALKHFNVTYAGIFQLSESEDVRTRLVGALLSLLKKTNGIPTDDPTVRKDFQATALQSLRIICRETIGLDDLKSPGGIKVICNLAGWITDVPDNSEEGILVQEEALKCLCNLVLKNPPLATECYIQGVVQGIMQRMARKDDMAVSQGIQFFDARLLFLVTALASETRPVIVRKLNGIPVLTHAVESCILESPQQLAAFTAEKCTLSCELLKILYCLALDVGDPSDEDIHAFSKLVHIIRLILTSEHGGWSKDLKSHAVNLLINMPGQCAVEFVPPSCTEKKAAAAAAQSTFESYDLSAVDALLDYLLSVLTNLNSQPSPDAAVPVLTAVRSVAKSCRIARKYMRVKILPCLKQVILRPEDSGGLKSLLVPLMTSHVTNIKEMVADFLFILCKENMSRLIKYTGYGNAAGMLFQRGLLTGGKNEPTTVYSTDEDTDTDEYLESDIDPVTGGPQQPKPDPMAGMTEEEKEAEAEKLADMLEQLTASEFLKVVPLGASGQPVMSIKNGSQNGQVNGEHDEDDE